jgi:hypothetical protein
VPPRGASLRLGAAGSAGRGYKSITWLECERVVGEGKEVLAFLLDDTVPWPAEHRDDEAIARAVREGQASPKLLKEVQAKVKGLQDLKKWLNGRAITARFKSAEDLRGKIEGALHDWRWRHTVGVAEQEPKHGRTGRDKESYDLGPSARGPVVLQAILKPRCRAVVIGDPGSEKSTFLRRVAHALAERGAWGGGGRRSGPPRDPGHPFPDPRAARGPCQAHRPRPGEPLGGAATLGRERRLAGPLSRGPSPDFSPPPATGSGEKSGASRPAAL